MCQICDGMSFEQVRHSMNERIKKYGFTIQYVEAEETSECFAYTIGLTDFGQPEFCVRGMTMEDSGIILNGVATDILHRGDFYAAGHTAAWKGNRILYFARMRWARNYALGVYSRYGSRARVLEIHLMPEGFPAACGGFHPTQN
ncbi:hypothetical protein GCM10027417_13690 [Glutamicibacter endophyticus]